MEDVLGLELGLGLGLGLELGLGLGLGLGSGSGMYDRNNLGTNFTCIDLTDNCIVSQAVADN